MSKFMLSSSPKYGFLLSFYMLLIITISYLVPSSLCSETTNLKNITSCFIDHNINNFTLFPSNNVSSSSPAYFHLLNFSLQNLRFSCPSVSKPSAIILPSSKEEISSIVLCCRKWSFDIRSRSGGHSYEGISSSSSSALNNETAFVVIDMMNLNSISVDLESEVAWVEGGATLGETYYAIAESSNIHGFPAGACPTVGVGGHFAGGGYGFLGRKYGVSADNIVDALLVDAEGRVLDRDGMGEDVFWAIRGGGGGNWGIVFAWKIRVVRVPETVTVFSVARPQETEHQLINMIHQFQYVAPNLPDEFHLLAFLSSGLLPKTTEMAVIFQGLYQGPRNEAISILADRYPQLGITEVECKEMSWIDSVNYLSDFTGGQSSSLSLKDRYFQGKSYFKTKSDYVRKPLPSLGIKILIDVLRKQPKAYALFEPYGGFMEKTRSDAIAFPHREGNLFSIEYTIAWGETDDTNGKSKEYIDWIRELYETMTPYVSSNPRAAYVNYMDLDLGEAMEFDSTSTNDIVRASSSPVEMARAWGEKYFLKNYERLVMAKTMIDPHNVFKHQQSVPPLLLNEY